jgi:hypothetical protein
LHAVCVNKCGLYAAELEEAGAVAVFDSLVALCDRLDETPLR